MSSAKGRILRLLGDLILGEARVSSIADPTERFRVVALEGSTTADDRYEPGDKLQILLPDADVRTYTPIGWSDRKTTLLAWLHGSTPGVEWARGLRVGDRVRYIGPQRSVTLPSGPAVVVGDETSIAVAAALSHARPGRIASVIASTRPEEVAIAAVALGLANPVAVSSPIAAIEAVISATAGRPSAVWLTGGTELIRVVRGGLRDRGIRDLHVKAYWAPGKVGLD